MTASMTRKHFDALAAALRESRPITTYNFMLSEWEKKGGRQWEYDVAQISSVCARFNPNFDRARFLKACGVEG